MNFFKNYHTFFVFLFSVISIAWGNSPQENKGILEYSYTKVLKLSINSSINPATFSYLESGFKHAQKSHFELILLELNTPGGLVSTTKEILTLIGKSSIPIIIWVTPEGASATSAGAIIASGAHFLFMSPGTNIGAATPITLNEPSDSEIKFNPFDKNKEKGNSNQNETKELQNDDKGNNDSIFKNASKAKAVNDLMALVRGLSEIRGRNGALYEEMIYKASSFTSQEAKKGNLIDEIAPLEKNIWQYINGKIIEFHGAKIKIIFNGNLDQQNPEVHFFDMDLGQKILNIFANPTLTYICFILGAALLYLELQAPGGFIAGGIGAFFLIIAGIGFQVLPINLGGLGLMILSFLLFMLEIYVTSYGVLTLAGLISLFFGSSFLYRSHESLLDFEHGIIWSAVLAVGSFVGFITFYLVKDFRKNKKKNEKHNDYNKLGRSAVVTEILTTNEDNHSIKKYSIKIDGEIWSAYSEKKFELGEKVKIIDKNTEKLSYEIDTLSQN